MDLSLVGILILGVLILESAGLAYGNLVFPVHHKFKGLQKSLSALKAHDIQRRGRILSAVDLNLGGNGHPSETGLYFATIGIGSPSKNYYVQVDTGSDILWVNCVECTNCPKKSDIGIELTLYDPKSSKTSELVTCDQDFCTSTYDGNVTPGCKAQYPCRYKVVYGDGSSTAGYFVKDYLKFDRVSGNLQTAPTNGSVIFGCGAKQTGGFGKSSQALDGILGFGQANSSMISQLAISGKVKKIFSHCLDNVNGGGIFSIGEVVQPRVNTTALVPNQAHYNVIMKAIEVDGDVLELPTDIFESGDGKGTIIDSGTTLAYFPDLVYEPLMTKILGQQPGLKLQTVQDQFTCFQYTGNVDDGFSTVKFHFEDSLSLMVYPHDYLFQIREDVWCVGWQKSGMQSKGGSAMTILGDLVLSNKLVLYDLDNQVIGWTEYNCSSNIKVKDEKSGTVYTVGAHNISSASSVLIGRMLTFFLLLIGILNNVSY
ncbi:Aspartic proteinase-like protein 2 [Quillaja saponaria]|uniref:Aspartic proteinase-like protein 2 n=1 Tax=Quillaja saponaria TaxID=32244 RepID=A0AAD7Q2E7_QUISA|nr:Aspartic proteinase-like protein 2 [Quillaja saponaria]